MTAFRPALSDSTARLSPRHSIAALTIGVQCDAPLRCRRIHGLMKPGLARC